MWDLSIFLDASAWIALLTLTAMEIILGIDNIVFISIVTDELPVHQRARARRIGLGLALITRIALLITISWVMGLVEPLFQVMGREISGRDLILLGGGLFLIAKATHEMFEKLEGGETEGEAGSNSASFISTLIQIMLLDIIFSLDSVITAVGMAQHLLVMIIAVMVAVGVMLVFAGSISDFINRRPSMKILALSFLILIGVMLVAEGLGQHIDKGYIYFAMGFSLFVELIKMRIRKGQQPVKLHTARHESHSS